MTTNLRYSKKDSQHLLFHFLSRNIAIKPGHNLPKEFGDFIRIEIDQINSKEINLLLINKKRVHRLNRAKIPSKISIQQNEFMEFVFYFTEVGFGAEPPLNKYQFTFKICLHLTLTGKSAAFLFLVEQFDEYASPEEIYLGRLFLQPNVVQLNAKNKRCQLAR